MSETKQQEATTGVEPELEVTETSTDAPAVDSSDKTERGREVINVINVVHAVEPVVQNVFVQNLNKNY